MSQDFEESENKDVVNKPIIKIDLSKLSVKEIAKMNKYIVDNYPNIDRNATFENQISCGDYCLALIRREHQKRRNKSKSKCA